MHWNPGYLPTSTVLAITAIPPSALITALSHYCYQEAFKITCEVSQNQTGWKLPNWRNPLVWIHFKANWHKEHLNWVIFLIWWSDVEMQRHKSNTPTASGFPTQMTVMQTFDDLLLASLTKDNLIWPIFLYNVEMRLCSTIGKQNDFNKKGCLSKLLRT